MPRRPADPAAKARLIAQCECYIDAVERADGGGPETFSRYLLREHAGSVTALRGLLADLKAMTAGLSGPDRQALQRALAERCGVDEAVERAAAAAAIAPIRARGRIRTEAEYRRVQAYADSLPSPEAESEYLALAALLDEFMSRGAT